MKKFKFITIAVISICAILAVFLSSCGRTESADGKPSETVATGSITYFSVSSVDYYSSGMHYKVFNSANGNVFVVNITKDSLEIIKNNR